MDRINIAEIIRELKNDYRVRLFINIGAIATVSIFIFTGLRASYLFYNDKAVSWLWIQSPDTVYVTKEVPVIIRDTIPTYAVDVSAQKNAVGVIQGDGNKVGDTFIEGVKQRKLDDMSKSRLLNTINKIMKEHNLPLDAEIHPTVTMGNEEANVFLREIANFLFANGYNPRQEGWVMSSGSFKIELDKSDSNKISLYIGKEGMP